MKQQRIHSFEDLRESGILWAINAHIFHPRGLVFQFVYDDRGLLQGWRIVGDGTKVPAFKEDVADEQFNKFKNTLGGLCDKSDDVRK